MIRVLVVDDHDDVRATLAAVLAAEPDFGVVKAVTAGNALDHVARSDPDVVLLSHRPETGDGLQQCAAISRKHPRARVLVALHTPSHEAALAAFEAGASGVVVKGTDPALFRHAVRAVSAGGAFLDTRLTRPILDLALRVTRAGVPDAGAVP